MKQISMETIQKLLKPFVDKSRTYSHVFKVSNGTLVFTNGYFLISIRNAYTSGFADGVYSLATGMPSNIPYPNTDSVTPECEKEVDVLPMLTVAELVKPAGSHTPIINLSGRILKSGEGYNLRYIRLALDLGLCEVITNEQEDCLLFRSEITSLLVLKIKGN